PGGRLCPKQKISGTTKTKGILLRRSAMTSNRPRTRPNLVARLPCSARGPPLHQSNQLPAAPDQKANDQKYKKARSEEFTSRMRRWRKVIVVIKVLRRVNRRFGCAFYVQSARLCIGHVRLPSPLSA